MRHARNHWKRFDNVREALAPAIERRGYFPTQAELRKQRLSSVWDAMKKYHGGYHAVAAKLGVPTKKECREHFKNWDVFKSEMENHLREGYFPSVGELLKWRRTDLAFAVKKYHGGVKKAAARMGVPTWTEWRRFHEAGYWTEERIVTEYRAFIKEFSYPHWPTPGDIRKEGYGALSRAVQKIGYALVRDRLMQEGMYLPGKPRRLEHLRPFTAKYSLLPEVFDEGELKYYFLGLVSADGTVIVRKHERSVELCLNEADRSILEMLRDRISPDRPLHEKPHRKKGSTAVRFKVSGPKIVEMLLAYMPAQRKSLFMTWPENLSFTCLHHYVRGIIDGDGTIGVASNRQTVNGKTRYYHVTRLRILGTEPFLTGLASMIAWVLDLPVVRVNRKGSENVYEIQYGGSHADQLLEWVYTDATLFLARKKEVWETIRNSPRRTLARRYGTPLGRYNRRAKGRKGL